MKKKDKTSSLVIKVINTGNSLAFGDDTSSGSTINDDDTDRNKPFANR